MKTLAPRRTRLALLLCIVLVAAGGCDSLGGLVAKPSADIVGVHLDDVSFTSATLLFDVEVDNPYSVALPLTNVDYALTSLGEQFLTGQAPLEGAIPANGSRVLPVPVEVQFLSLIKAVADIRPGMTVPYQADIGLSVDAPLAGPLRLPMKRDGELDIPEIPTSIYDLPIPWPRP